MRINDLYFWQLEMADGTVHSQWSPDGQESAWKDIKDLDQVVRASLIPKISALPRHDCIIDINNGHRFVKRFGRGFLKIRAAVQFSSIWAIFSIFEQIADMRLSLHTL